MSKALKDKRSSDAVSLPALHMVPRFIVARSGLKYLEENPQDLERVIRDRMADLLFETETEYLAYLQDGEKGKKEFERLAKELTVGETYFFRHREQFEAVKKVMPTLLEKKGQDEGLRVWSAACSNGAELYSLSILLRENFGAHPALQSPYLVGTDINPDALAKANAARYEEWSLRGVTESERAKYFDSDAKGKTVKAEYRQGVQFHFHNLAHDPIPSASHNLFGFDIIFLRNVLIYFDIKSLSHFLGTVCEALVPGGYLAVAPAEVGPDFEKWFETVSFPGCLLYRKPENAEAFRARVDHKTIKPTKDVATAVMPRPVLDELPPGATSEMTLEAAMKGANAGHFVQARHLLEGLISKDSLNYEAHYYLGLVTYSMGNFGEAEGMFRRVIYIRRDFYPAQFHLALLYRKANENDEAERLFENLKQKLESRDPKEVVYAREALHVGDLLAMVRAAQQNKK